MRSAAAALAALLLVAALTAASGAASYEESFEPGAAMQRPTMQGEDYAQSEAATTGDINMRKAEYGKRKAHRAKWEDQPLKVTPRALCDRSPTPPCPVFRPADRSRRHRTRAATWRRGRSCTC